MMSVFFKCAKCGHDASSQFDKHDIQELECFNCGARFGTVVVTDRWNAKSHLYDKSLRSFLDIRVMYTPSYSDAYTTTNYDFVSYQSTNPWITI